MVKNNNITNKNTLLIVPIIGPSYDDVVAQITQAQTLADIIEMRWDLIDSDVVSRFSSCIRCNILPMIFTIRHHDHGGMWDDSEDARLSLFLILLRYTPEYIDCEYDAGIVLKGITREKDSETKLIVSYHNMKSTPQDLDALLLLMREAAPGGDIFKVATYAVSSCDALRMISFAQKAPGPFIGVCMGEKGAVTRVSAPMMRCWGTYAALGKGKATAEGQMTAEEMVDIYRYREITKDTRLCALIGDPVTLSRGHIYHNKVFHENKRDILYIKIQLDLKDLSEFFALARTMPFVGMSVTMPLKEAVISYFEKVDGVAEEIGALNTICFRDGKMEGYNTDGVGAFDAIEKKCSVEGKRVIVVGAGGTARALVHEAQRRGAEVVIINRTYERAQQIAELYGAEAIPFSRLKEVMSLGYDVVINATSVGMATHAEDSIVEEEWFLPGTIAFDVVSVPEKTLFLSCAEQARCSIVTGKEMFRCQADLQQKLWNDF
jgi:3-dehydroquinate dehydratase / shikimate dehydrogenase